MKEWIVLGGIAAAGILTFLDKENLLLNSNPGKVWWWQRILPQQPATAQQQQIKELVATELRRREEAEAAAKSRSKYSVTSPGVSDYQWPQRKQGAY